MQIKSKSSFAKSIPLTFTGMNANDMTISLFEVIHTSQGQLITNDYVIGFDITNELGGIPLTDTAYGEGYTLELDEYAPSNVVIWATKNANNIALAYAALFVLEGY